MAKKSAVLFARVMTVDHEAPGPAVWIDPPHQVGNKIVGSFKVPDTNATGGTLTKLDRMVVCNFNNPVEGGELFTAEQFEADPQFPTSNTVTALTLADAGTEKALDLDFTVGMTEDVAIWFEAD